MNMTILMSWTKEFRRRLGVFGTPIGASFGLISLAVVLGAPMVTHADSGGFLNFIYGFVDCTTSTVSCALSATGYAIFTFSNFILGIVGWLFNVVIIKTVFQFGTVLNGNAGIIAGWKILRDVCNIGLLFGFVFTGIATILDIHSYEAKKTLPRLVIFAVLLNFSLLVSQGIIDTANIFSSTLYSQSSQSEQCANAADQAKCEAGVGISGTIVQQSGMSAIFDQGLDVHAGLIFYLGLSVLATILAVVLLAGTIMLITRAVVLTFLMVLSPIGFAGFAVPFLERFAKLWWDKLLSQAFFAPVFLLLIFVGLKVGATLNLDHTGSIANAFKAGSATTIDVFLIFGLVVGFFIAALMSAKQMGAMGAGFATNMATKAVAYPFALVGRNTGGYLANRSAKVYNAYAGKIAAKYGALEPEKKKGLFRPLNRLARGAYLAGSSLGAGVDESVIGGLKTVSSAKIGGFDSFEDRQKSLLERSKESAHAMETDELKTALTEAIKTGNKDEAEKIAQKLNLHGLEEAIKTMSAEQIAKLGEVLSPEKFSKLMDSKEVGDHKKDEMRAARFADVLAKKKDAKDLALEDLEELSKLDKKFFSDLITDKDKEGKSLLKEDQLEAVGKSKDLGDDLRKLARDNTAARRVDEYIKIGNISDAENLLDHMTSKQKASLKAETLKATDPSGKMIVVAKLDPNDLSALTLEGKLASTDRQTISTEIISQHVGDPVWENAFEKNKLLAQQWGWPGADKQIQLLTAILAKL